MLDVDAVICCLKIVRRSRRTPRTPARPAAGLAIRNRAFSALGIEQETRAEFT